MIENIKNASPLIQGLFIGVVGLIGVFVILVLFYFMIKGFEKIGERNNNDN